MIRSFINYLKFRRAVRILAGLPELYAAPDMTGKTADVIYTFATPGVNTEVPQVGDVVIALEITGAPGSIRRDTRWRVVGPPVNNSVVPCMRRIDNKKIETDYLSISCMRRHFKLARTWVQIR